MATRNLYAAIGRRIADERRAVGMSQAAVAAAVGTTQAVISQIERGAGVPSIARVEAIAAALGVPIGALFTFDGEAPAPAAPHEAAVARFAALARKLSAKEIESVLGVAESLARSKRRGRT